MGINHAKVARIIADAVRVNLEWIKAQNKTSAQRASAVGHPDDYFMVDSSIIDGAQDQACDIAQQCGRVSRAELSLILDSIASHADLLAYRAQARAHNESATARIEARHAREELANGPVRRVAPVPSPVAHLEPAQQPARAWFYRDAVRRVWQWVVMCADDSPFIVFEMPYSNPSDFMPGHGQGIDSRAALWRLRAIANDYGRNSDARAVRND